MASPNAFATYVVEALSDLGPVQTGRMFSGHNVSLHGVTFGLIFRDVLYLKVDDTNRAMFERANLRPFTYQTKQGKEKVVNYYEAPDCLDDWEALMPWVYSALDVAHRKAKATAAKKTSKSVKKTSKVAKKMSKPVKTEARSERVSAPRRSPPQKTRSVK